MIDITALVRSIQLYQRPVYEIESSSNYLIGVHDGNWMEIITKMLSKSLYGLEIVNNSYPNYLTTESVDLLSEVRVSSVSLHLGEM